MGNKVGALFDMDETVLDCNSGKLFAKYMVKTRQASLVGILKAVHLAILHRRGRLTPDKLSTGILAIVRIRDEAQLTDLYAKWFTEDVVDHIAKGAIQSVTHHLQQGHIVGLITSSVQYAVAPLAEHLGIPGQFVCTQLEAVDGRLTGRILEPVCYGEGKVVWAKRFSERYQVDLTKSYFYTDNNADLPLMERVAHPIAVNPEPVLKAIAIERGWPVEMFY